MKYLLLIILTTFPIITEKVLYGKSIEELSKPNPYKHIKSWETWHHIDTLYVAYGHLKLKGEENFKPTLKQGDSLLKIDLIKHSSPFNYLGKDSLVLGLLAYNIGVNGVIATGIPKLIANKVDKEIIKAQWLKICYYNGKKHYGLQKRRLIEVIYFLNN